MRVVKLIDGTIGKVIIGSYDQGSKELFMFANYGRYSENELPLLSTLEFTEGTQEDYIKYIEEDFCWGDIIKTHVISHYQIIEYLTKKDNIYSYHPYINFIDTNHSYNSMDEALTGVIVYNKTDGNSQINELLWKMLK